MVFEVEMGGRYGEEHESIGL